MWPAGGRIERGLVQLNLGVVESRTGETFALVVVQYPKYVLGWDR